MVIKLPSSWTVLFSIRVIKLITRKGLPRTELNDYTSLYNSIMIMCKCTYKTNPIALIPSRYIFVWSSYRKLDTDYTVKYPFSLSSIWSCN